MILANSFEYRMPSADAERRAREEAQTTGLPSRADMTSRFVGLIVIPGHQIVKVMLEEVDYTAPRLGEVAQPGGALSIRNKS